MSAPSLGEYGRALLTVREYESRPQPLKDVVTHDQIVSHAELSELQRRQSRGLLSCSPGEAVRVFVQDDGGRRISHFFGDEGSPWALFQNPPLTGVIRGAR